MTHAFILWSLMLVQAAYAQPSDTALYHLTHSSTGFINRASGGNGYLLNNAFKVNVSHRRSSANLLASWIYGRQQGKFTNNDVTAGFDFNLFKDGSRLYYWGLAGFDRSYSLAIARRVQAGAGIGFTITETPTTYIVISEGPIYEAGKPEELPSYQTVRNSFRIRYKFGTQGGRVQFEGINFLQQSYEDWEDYLLRSNHTLSLKLNGWLSVNAALTYNKVSVTAKENLLFNFGLMVDRYF